ncbi:hypothetical protein FALCPG4_007308 [Fusarium falciforme]
MPPLTTSQKSLGPWRRLLTFPSRRITGGRKPLLKLLGVKVEADFDFYLASLRHAKNTGNGSVELIRRLMHELEEHGNSSSLVNPFRKDKLILVPPKTKGGERRWVSQDECFWRGEFWPTQSLGLERLYPDLETFFRDHLIVRNAGIDHLIKEAAAVPTLPQPALSGIQRLFLALEYHVKAHGLSEDQKKALLNTKMFPTTSTVTDETYEYLSSATVNNHWLIADRSYFREPFQSLIPVLAFAAEFISKIMHLLVKLGLKNRFLSDLAVSTTEAHENTHLNEDLSYSYRSRGKYFCRYVLMS